MGNIANKITKYNSSGTYLGVFATTGLQTPESLAVAPNGNIFAANTDNFTVTQYSPAGAYLGVFATVASPSAVAVSTSGNVYIAAFNQNSSIREFTPTGTLVSDFGSAYVHGPHAMAFSSSGNLYVANVNNTVSIFTPNGTFVAFSSNTGLNFPTAIAFSHSGNFFVSNAGNSTITKYAANGTYLGTIALNSQLFVATGPAFTPSDTMLLGLNNGTIVQFSQNGTNLGIFATAGLHQPFQIVAVAPVALLTQPHDIIATVGYSAPFSVTATGALSYHWQRKAFGSGTFANLTNVSPYTGVTSPTMAVVNITNQWNGDKFRCIVSGPGGNLTSNAATLTVNPIILIATQPINQQRRLGQPVTFTATVEGPHKLSYQWFHGDTALKNGANLTGATTARLTIRKITDTDLGDYKVTITGNGPAGSPGNSATSNTATLSLTE